MSGFPPVSNESQRYIVGPAVELRLRLGFAAEFEALYRPFGYTQSFRINLGFPEMTRERAHSWEFPLIAKYRFRETGLHPFLGLGYEPRIVNATDVSQFSTAPAPMVYSTTHGLVVSGDRFRRPPPANLA